MNTDTVFVSAVLVLGIVSIYRTRRTLFTAQTSWMVILTALGCALTIRVWGVLLTAALLWLLPFSTQHAEQLALILGPTLWWLSWVHKLSNRASPIRVERGTTLLGEAPSNRASTKSAIEPVRFAGQAIPRLDEVKHFKCIGTTGTGKSTAIASLLDSALLRGDRMIIADPNGGYLNRWYQPHTDDVLNPFDPLSVQWDLFKEIRKPSDYDALAQALIVGQARTEMVWINYARVFLATLLRRCHRAHLIQLSQLLHLVQSAPLDDLRLLLKDSPVSPFLESGNERMFASIRSVCMSALNSLQYLPEPQDQGFSVRSFVLSDRRALFLPYQADQIASLRSLISTWLRLAIETLLSRGESDDPVWIVVDELDALGAIDGLKDALVRLRKHGGRCVLGFQSIGQLVGTYGEHDAKTIGENCGNTLILRCSGSGAGGTARYAQEQVGDRQVLRQHINTTRPKRLGGFWSRSESVAWQRTIEPALLASEIEQLPDLQGFVKCASDAYWRRVILSLP